MSLEEVGPKRLGTTIRDKWVLERLLGVGGMASVYVARHKIGRLEAIKILHADIARSEQIRARFEQEALAVNAFRHPGVVEVRDVDVTDDGAPFMVMELLEGESLSDRIRRDPPLETHEVLAYARDVLDVLVEAHARHIVHRDIKPDNLFVLNGGRIKVLDFGIARVRSSLGRAKTQLGMTLGTMAYMPPEQACGREIDGRADIYALGATMFRVLTGTTVHDAKTEGELVKKATSEPAPSIASRVPSLPPGVQAVVDRALAFDVAHRYPDAASMRADVSAVLEGRPPPHASNAPPLPSRPEPAAVTAPAPSTARDAATYIPPARQEAVDTARQGGGIAPPSGPTKVPPTVDDPALMATQAEGVPVPMTAPMGPPRGAPLHPGVVMPTKVSAGSNAPPAAPTLVSGVNASAGPGPVASAPMPASRGVPAALIAALVVGFLLIAGIGVFVASRIGGVLAASEPPAAAPPSAASADAPTKPAQPATTAKPAAALSAAPPSTATAPPAATAAPAAAASPAATASAAPTAAKPASTQAPAAAPKGKGKGKPKKPFDLAF